MALVYKFKKLIGRDDFPFKIAVSKIIHVLSKRIGCNMNAMRQSAILDFTQLLLMHTILSSIAIYIMMAPT